MKMRISPNVRIGTLFFWFLLIGSSIFAQTRCTLNGTSPVDWVNSGPSCAEGGLFSAKQIVVVPAGYTLNIDNGDAWSPSGSPVGIVIFGIVNINADVTFNCSILVAAGGVLNLNAKLNLGSGAGCGYGVGMQDAQGPLPKGKVDVGGTGSDRLNVCGKEMMKGNGSCNDCGGTNSGTCAYNNNPYCEPAAGFTGPTGFGESGYTPALGTSLTTALPIRLKNFTAENYNDFVLVKWATEKEENFDRFELERANSKLNFIKVTDVQGAGYNTDLINEYSWMDANPFPGQNYYRLKAVDLDGSFEYFNIVSASASGNRKFTVFPNPTKENFVNFSVNFEYTGNDKIVVMDNMGNIVQQTLVSTIGGKLVFGETINPGLYFVQYKSDDFTQTVRVTIR